MAKIVERSQAATGRTCFICDYSPPRSGRPEDIPTPPENVDFVSVAYNPGRVVRVNSVAMAAALRDRHGAAPIFTLATRDMNRLALESLLLGAQALGLENVIAVAGDPFGPRDPAAPVNDYRTTELIAAIANLNQGVDHRGRPLRAATDFCIGATVDLGRGIDREARLTVRKVEAGAHFLITQPVFDPEDVERFADAYAHVAGDELTTPVFYGVGLMEPDGVSFRQRSTVGHRRLGGRALRRRNRFGSVGGFAGVGRRGLLRRAADPTQWRQELYRRPRIHRTGGQRITWRCLPVWAGNGVKILNSPAPWC